MSDDSEDYENIYSNEHENVDIDLGEMKTAANTGESVINAYTNIEKKPKLVRHNNINEEMIDNTTHKPLLNEIDE
jgi:hypothetical protein